MAAGICATSSAQILQVHTDSLTDYKTASRSAVQDVHPLAIQRAVDLDGRMRRGVAFPLAIAGNPFASEPTPSVSGVGLMLADGSPILDAVDLSLPAPGFQWTVSRSFNARQHDGTAYGDSDGPQGINWFQNSLPEIVLHDDVTNTNDVVYLILGADRYAEFVRSGGSSSEYVGRNGANGVFQFVAGAGSDPDAWVLYDSQGNRAYFFGFDGDAGPCVGQFWKFLDPAGNVAYVGDAASMATAKSSGYDGSGRATTVYQSLDGSATRRFTYDYTSGRLDSVTVAEKPSGGSYADTGAKVEYSYYGSETYGDPGDLKLVTLTNPLSDSGVTLVSWTYYRYYEGTFHATTNPGNPHQVKHVWNAEGLRRYDWLDSTFNQTFLSATDTDLSPYASAEYEYDSDRRVVKTWMNGACGCSGGANGEHELEYEVSGATPTSGYDRAWRTRTIVKLPAKTDVTPNVSAYETHYFDETGQALHLVITDADPDNTSPAPGFWATKVTRDTSGRVEDIRTPANASAYAHTTGVITSQTGTGLVWSYHRLTTGDMTGFIEHVKHQTGTSGSAYLDGTTSYSSRSLTVGSASIVRPFVTDSRAYAEAVTSGTTGSMLTSYARQWWSATTTDPLYLVPKQLTTTYPAVSTTKNGSGSATTSVAYLRADGTVALAVAPDGVVHYSGLLNGLPVTEIADAQTSHATDFGSADDPNGTWGITESGTGLHKKTVNTFDGEGRRLTSTAPSGRVLREYHSRLLDRRMVHLAFPDYSTSSGVKYYGPVSYTVSNLSGAPEVIATVGLTNDESTLGQTSHVDEADADPITAMDLGTITAMRVSIYGETGERLAAEREYFAIPASGAGTDGTHYDATLHGYDDAGRRWRTEIPSGTVTRTVFDVIGRKSSEWIGTNDNGSQFPGGDTSGTLDMVSMGQTEYDGGATGGNSYLTGNTAYVEGSTTGQSVVGYTNNVFGQPVFIANPQAPHTLFKYDNLRRRVATAQYSSTSGITHASDPTILATNRLSLVQTFFDELGREWKSQWHKVDAVDGSDDDNLATERWFDGAGRLVKVDAAQLVKYGYDRLGRQTRVYLLASDNDTTYGDCDDVTGDIVLEERHDVFDPSTDDVVLSCRIQRHHDDVGGSQTTGPLDTNADSNDLAYTATNLKGRPDLTAIWYDRFGREQERVRYGTNGGLDFDRSGLSVPARSDDALRVSTEYGSDGEVLQVVDPRGLKTRWSHDAVGRVTAEVENYVDGTPSGSPTAATSADDVTTRFSYVDGLKTKSWVDRDGDGTEDADDPVTLWTYGVTKGTSSGDSKISAGHLLATVQHPDSSGGSDVLKYAYNAQERIVWAMDQAGNVLETDADTRGRVSHFRLTTVASGFDSTVRRISLTYDILSRLTRVTQWDNASAGSGTVLNEVAYSYDDWSNRTAIYLDRDSAVASSGGNEYAVTHTYVKATGGRNALRKSRTMIPGSGTGPTGGITYSYSTAGHDDNVSRVSAISFDGTRVAEYEYLGMGSLVGVDYAQPDVFRRRYGTSSGTYPDLDRFGRVIADRWTKDLSTDRDFYSTAITWDRNSSPARVEDQIRKSGSTGHFDLRYTYDDLDRLTQAEQGDWTGSTIASLRRNDLWQDATDGGLDQSGNWVRWKLDKNGDGDFVDTGDFDEKRTHSAANELLTRNTDNSGAVEYTTTFDAIGNLTDDGKSYKYEFDPLGRLVRVRNRSTDALVAECAYYGNGYRASEKYDTDADGDVDGSDLTYYFVYDDAWRLVATYRSSDSNPKEQFVPHLAGLDGQGAAGLLDDLVLRNRDESSAWTAASDGTMETRRYYCQNWRADVVTMITETGAQVEEVRYSPYGEPFGMFAGDVDDDGDVDGTDRGQVGTWASGGVYDARGDLDRDGDVDTADRNAVNANIGKNLGWGVQSYSATGNRRGYAGYETGLAGIGLMHVRCRAYQAELGRWLSRDPLGPDAAGSMYAYVNGQAIASVDSLGLQGIVPPAVPIPAEEIRKTDDAVPIPAPGSGLTLGFIMCPDSAIFGVPGDTPDGVTPVDPSKWVVPPGTIWSWLDEPKSTCQLARGAPVVLLTSRTRVAATVAREVAKDVAVQGGKGLGRTPYGAIVVLALANAWTWWEIYEMEEFARELAKPSPAPGPGESIPPPDDPNRRRHPPHEPDCTKYRDWCLGVLEIPGTKKPGRLKPGHSCHDCFRHCMENDGEIMDKCPQMY